MMDATKQDVVKEDPLRKWHLGRVWKDGKSYEEMRNIACWKKSK